MKVIEFREDRKTRHKAITLSDEAVRFIKEDMDFYKETLPVGQKKKLNVSSYLEMLAHMMHKNTLVAKGEIMEAVSK